MLLTSEGVFVSLDLGLEIIDNESDKRSVEEKLEKKCIILSLKGYVQKRDIRRNYQAVVHLIDGWGQFLSVHR